MSGLLMTERSVASAMATKDPGHQNTPRAAEPQDGPKASRPTTEDSETGKRVTDGLEIQGLLSGPPWDPILSSAFSPAPPEGPEVTAGAFPIRSGGDHTSMCLVFKKGKGRAVW